jgi:hypothetical protein
MKYNCRSCQREFSKLLIPLERINNLPRQLRPGDTVPDGQCTYCRGFVDAVGRLATAYEISCARVMYQGCDLEIDNNAKASHADEHVWIQAWVYVPK